MKDSLLAVVVKSGLKQAEIARRIGEDRDWVNNRLRGRTTIHADDLPRLAGALGMSPCDFFNEPDQAAEAYTGPVYDRRAPTPIRPLPTPAEVADEGEPEPATSETTTVGQRILGRSLRELEQLPEADLALFFDFLEWRRAREAQPET